MFSRDTRVLGFGNGAARYLETELSQWSMSAAPTALGSSGLISQPFRAGLCLAGGPPGLDSIAILDGVISSHTLPETSLPLGMAILHSAGGAGGGVVAVGVDGGGAAARTSKA